MSNSNDDILAEALQDVKEAYLVSVARRLISSRIPAQVIIMLSRSHTATDVIRQLKRSYFLPYLWNKMMRAHRRQSSS